MELTPGEEELSVQHLRSVSQDFSIFISGYTEFTTLRVPDELAVDDMASDFGEWGEMLPSQEGLESSICVCFLELTLSRRACR